MLGCHLLQLGQTGHCAVRIQYLNQRGSRSQSRQTRHVNTCLGMPRTAQNTFILSIKWIDVPRAAKVRWTSSRVGQMANRCSSVGSTHACCTSLQFVNGDCERRSEHGCVVLYLMGQFQFFGTADSYRSTKHSASILQHEVHFFRSDHLCSRDKITLVLAVFVINNNNELALTEVFYCILYRRQYGVSLLFHNYTALFIICTLFIIRSRMKSVCFCNCCRSCQRRNR